MNHLCQPRETVLHLVDLLKHSCDLLIDARLVGPEPGVGSRAAPGGTLEISGPDAPLFLCNEAELLKAFHDIAGSAHHLSQPELDRLWFEIDVKPDRIAELPSLAVAVDCVPEMGGVRTWR